jgi:thioredoxin reductase (NADPH)
MSERTDLRREDVREVIIIGSGPAGLTAALYTARALLRPLVLEGDGFYDTMPGGQLTITTEVENFPGLVRWEGERLRGMTGPELVDQIRRHAQHFGAECVARRVTRVDFSRRPLRIECDDDIYYAEVVIVATGASARWLGLPSEAEYRNFGVSACATCDGALYRDKDVVVVGGGDTAMEEALFLTRHCRSVTVVHRRDQLRASKIMVERATAHPKIHFVWNSVVEEILGRQEGLRKFVTGVRLRDTKTGEQRELACDGVFVAIGHKPNTDLFRGQLEMDDHGYIRTLPHSTFTNARGVFAAGDCRDPVYRQAITAAGMGCMAAIDAERFMLENPIEFAG